MYFNIQSIIVSPLNEVQELVILLNMWTVLFIGKRQYPGRLSMETIWPYFNPSCEAALCRYVR